MFHSVFSPANMDEHVLSQTLVQRHSTIHRLTEIFRGQSPGGSTHNVLMVGPRGIGKTHMVSLIYKTLKRDPEFLKQNAIAYLREDEWGLSSYVDLLRRIVESIAEEEGRDLSANVTDEEELSKLIFSVADHRNVLLIIENLGYVFESIGGSGQQKLRGLIQNHPRFSFLATTPALFHGISRQSSPFFGFFNVIPLEPLTFEDAVALVKKLAAAEGDKSTAQFIQTPIGRARVRAVQHLAGGNHRIFVLFYEFLSQSGPEAVLPSLLRTIDGLTPYYQSQMDHLSPQQQKIVVFLCRQRVPANVKTIAAGCTISHQTATSQLKQLLENKYVRVTRSGRESYYELAEPLLRICLEVKGHKEGPLRLLVEFLRFWFSREELQHHLSTDVRNVDRNYFSAALKQYSSGDGHDHLDPEIRKLCRAIDSTRRSPKEVYECAQELSELSKRVEDWGHYVRGMVFSGRASEAIEYLERKLSETGESFRLLEALGDALAEAGKTKQALAAFEKATTFDQGSPFPYISSATILLGQNKLTEAEEKINEALIRDPDLKKRGGVLRARIEIARGHFDRAIQLLKDLDPETEDDVANFMAVAYARKGDFKEAKRFFSLAEKLAPNAAYIKANLAWAQSRFGEYAAALKTLHSIEFPSSGTKRYTKGLETSILLAIGRFADAADVSESDDNLAHAIYHHLRNLYANDLPEPQKVEQLKKMVSVESKKWLHALNGGLIQFWRYVRDNNVTLESALALQRWFGAWESVLPRLPEFDTIRRVSGAWVAWKSTNNGKALLELPLEERRLLVSEREESELLGRTVTVN